MKRWFVTVAAFGSVILATLPVPAHAAQREGAIVFSSDRSGNWELYRVRPDGAGLKQITHTPGLDEDAPVWSPDLSRIAFVDDIGGQLFVMDSDGSNVRQLTDSSGGKGDPTWAPDGSRIAFDIDFHDIFVIGVDGSGLTQLTHTGINSDPDWSPDGSRISFESDRNSFPKETQIFTMNPDGSGIVQLTHTPIAHGESAWSPDGARIAFLRFHSWGSFDSQVFVMNANGSGVHRLTKAGTNWYPTWSPDGSRIAFFSTRDGNEEVYVMDADGSDQGNVTNDPGRDDTPDWSP